MTPVPSRRSWLSERMVDHAVQGVLIFASVFLAFWLNDYRIQVGERRATDAALAAVIHEVASNRAILERWMPYHREIGGRLEAELAGSSGDPQFDPYRFLGDRGIFREILTYDSWDYLRQADVRLDLQTRLAVNRAFRQQEHVDNAVRAAVAFLDSRELFEPDRSEENRLIFYRLIMDLYHQQRAMVETYDRLLETVGAR